MTAGTGGIGAVFGGGALAFNGAADVVSSAAKFRNAFVDDPNDEWHEENLIKTGAKWVGEKIGGDTGEKVGGYIYDAASIAGSIYGATCEVKEFFKPTMKTLENSYNSWSKLASSAGQDAFKIRYLRDCELMNGLQDVSSTFAKVTTFMGIPSDFKNLGEKASTAAKYLWNSTVKPIENCDLSSLNYGGYNEKQQYQRK